MTRPFKENTNPEYSFYMWLTWVAVQDKTVAFSFVLQVQKLSAIVGLGLGLHKQFPELGISLFEIAQSLFALERTFILGAMALLETKSGAQ